MIWNPWTFEGLLSIIFFSIQQFFFVHCDPHIGMFCFVEVKSRGRWTTLTTLTSPVTWVRRRDRDRVWKCSYKLQTQNTTRQRNCESRRAKKK
ncbi:MAG: LOW QUALITY PROTEIN: hypothetical protein JOS17DRAFT_758472 [Linnemannia elongata]|nr:MAG: LOW QUALITY PROTEIN: hypothetical protein JOS17DRAFT_758472 [Linnemannia elongata]